ncbi:hypothetical protein [Actinoplanes xinjiangensis]|uniref:hypothetical protein n=1 Tax=Actinoplanes xinjiangensis TaxID=512350 RepID=UPI00343FD93C
MRDLDEFPVAPGPLGEAVVAVVAEVLEVGFVPHLVRLHLGPEVVDRRGDDLPPVVVPGREPVVLLVVPTGPVGRVVEDEQHPDALLVGGVDPVVEMTGVPFDLAVPLRLDEFPEQVETQDRFLRSEVFVHGGDPADGGVRVTTVGEAHVVDGEHIGVRDRHGFRGDGRRGQHEEGCGPMK